MEPQSDQVGGFVPGPRAILGPFGRGALDGVRPAAKDRLAGAMPLAPGLFAACADLCARAGDMPLRLP